jgi:hypothetical protein
MSSSGSRNNLLGLLLCWIFNERFEGLECRLHGPGVVAFDVGPKRFEPWNQGALQRDLSTTFERLEQPGFSHATEHAKTAFDSLQCEALRLAQHHVLHVEQAAQSQWQDRFDHGILGHLVRDRLAFGRGDKTNALQAFVPT